MKNLKVFSSIDLSILTNIDIETIIRELRIEREILGSCDDMFKEFQTALKDRSVQNYLPYFLFTVKGAIYILKKYGLIEESKRIALIDKNVAITLNDFYESFIEYKQVIVEKKKVVKKKNKIDYHKKFFTITEICEPFDIGASKTNKLLEELGIIHKYKDEWVLSPGYHRLGRSLNTGYYHNQMVNYGKNKLRFNIGGLKYIRNILKTHGIKLKADK